MKSQSATEDFKAADCFRKLISDYAFETVLDVGCGKGPHTRAFVAAGKSVTPTDVVPLFEGVVSGDYLNTRFTEPFDCLWLSHVLEHQVNVNQFLQKARDDLKEGGILAITVPPMRERLAGGHVTLWNAGLLLYNLVVAGFDCSHARVKCYGYNISVITPKITARLPHDEMHFARGDLELLAPFFPKHPQLVWQQGVPGNIKQLNWDASELTFRTDLAESWRNVKQWLSPRRWFSRKRAA